MRGNEKYFRKGLGAALALGSLAIGGHFSRAATLSYNVYSLPVGDSPASLADSIFFDGKFIWAAIQNPDGGVLEKLSVTGQVLSTTAVGTIPIEMAYDGADIWVTDYTSNDVTIVDAGGNVVKTIALPGANPEGILFDGKYVWVADNGLGANSVNKFDVATKSLIATYTVGLTPDDVAFDGVSIWVTNSYNNNVWKLDRDSGAYIDGYSTGIYPLSIRYDGTNMWVGNGKGGSASAPVSGGGSLTKIRAADGATLGTYAIGSVVRGLLFDGTSIWACSAGANTVSRLRSTDVALLETYATGKAPRAVAFDGSKIWIANSGDNTITVIAPVEALGASTANLPFARDAFGAAASPRPSNIRGPGLPFRTPHSAASVTPTTLTKRVVSAPSSLGSMLDLLLEVN